MKKWWVLALTLCFIFPCFAFIGCTSPFGEKAICKVDGTAYSSLAEAIEVCEEGKTIYIYNDVKESLDNTKLQELGLNFASSSGNVYVEYVINKAISIVGVDKNHKPPKIYGSIKIQTSSTATLNNLEIINNYISLENNELNKPFQVAVKVLNGNLVMKYCNIHKFQNIDNQVIQDNNLSCLGGVEILRSDSELNGQVLNYHLSSNEISGYNNFTLSQQSFGISFISNREGFANLEPFTINSQTNDRIMVLESSNKIRESNNILTQVYNEESKIYEYLKTYNKDLIKEDNFDENSTVHFLGDSFGGDEKVDFNVYGAMSFKFIKNLNLIMKTSKAKVLPCPRQNVTVVPFVELP